MSGPTAAMGASGSSTVGLLRPSRAWPLGGGDRQRRPPSNRTRQDQVGHEGGPAGLVGGAEATAGVTVEVLVERRELTPVRVLLEACQPPGGGRRTPPVDAPPEQ